MYQARGQSWWHHYVGQGAGTSMQTKSHVDMLVCYNLIYQRSKLHAVHRSNSARFITMTDHKCKWSVGRLTVRSLASSTQLARIACSRDKVRQTIPRNYTSSTLPFVSDSSSSITQSVSDSVSSIARSVYRFTSHFHECWHALSSSYRLFHHCILSDFTGFS